MANTGMQSMMNPKSVAVIGASNNPQKVNSLPIQFLLKHGYQGPIYPINPQATEVMGLTCYGSILEVAEPVDTALIAIPAQGVLEAIKQCGEKGVSSATVFSSGFAETGPAGKQLQQEIAAVARQFKLRVCGPNCYGVINVQKMFAGSPNRVAQLERLIPGQVGLISQSGAMSGVIANRAIDAGVDFAQIVSTGNECDLEVNDFIEYCVDDPNTRVIALFLEGLRAPRRFMELAARALQANKPIVVLKVGRSATGQRTTVAHTGALAGSNEVYQAVFRKYGVIQVDDIDAMIDTLKVLTGGKRPQGPRVGVVCVSGGFASLVADCSEDQQLNLPDIPPEISRELKQMLTFVGRIENPLDVAGQLYTEPQVLEKAVIALGNSGAYDLIMAVLTSQAGWLGQEIAQGLIRAGKALAVPVFPLWAAGSVVEQEINLLRQARVQVFQNTGTLIKAISNCLRYREQQQKALRPVVAATLETNAPGEELELLTTDRKVLTEYESKLVLRRYGLTTTREVLASSVAEAGAAAEVLGFPLALKIQSPDIMHKTEAGGLRLGIASRAELEQAYLEIQENVTRFNPQAEIHGVLVQQMVKGGQELFMGVHRDAQFGCMILLGFGGIYVEVLKDIAMCPVPLTAEDAAAMIGSLKGKDILLGARGKTACDISFITAALMRLSSLAEDLGDVIEDIDLNPVIIFPQGSGGVIADASIVLSAKPKQ